MKGTLATIIFSLGIFYVAGQHNTFNQFNTKGKKQGYWVEYVDENMQVSDSLHFKYKRFEYYDNGKLILNLRKHYKYSKCKFYKNSQYDDRTQLLDGIVIDSVCKIKSQIDEYNNGYPVKFLFYACLSNCKDTGYIDKFFFKKLTDTSNIAFYYEDCNKNLKNNKWTSKKYCYMKTKKGKWKYVRIDAKPSWAK